MDLKRPIEEIKTEAAAILEKTIEGTAYADDGNGGHLFYSREQKRLILSAAESIPRLDTERLKRYIEDDANAPTIKTEFIDAYKKAYRATERAAAKQAAPDGPTPSESAPAKTEAEPLPQDQAEPEHAEEYTAAEIREIESNLIDVAGIPESCEFSKYVKTYGRDKAMLNEWLNGYGLGAAIPGNEEPAETTPEPAPAEAETLPEPEAEPETETTEAEPIGPAEAITEPQPSESKQEPAPSIPPHLNEHKRALNEHIANIRDDKQRAAFYDERDAITKSTAGDLETQDQEILTLCLKVKSAEDKQAAPAEPEPLAIRDEQSGTIINGTTGEAITGADAEAATEELDTAAKALKMLKKSQTFPPLENRTEPIRDFKHEKIINDDGRPVDNPVYVSTDPQAARYFLNTLNQSDLAQRIAAEIRGDIFNDTQPPVKGTKQGEAYWRCFNGTAYRENETLFNEAVQFTISTLYHEYAYLSETITDGKALGALLKFANSSKNDTNISGTINRLKKIRGISVNFDTVGSQSLIGLKNIIFNSATGEIIKSGDTVRINEVKRLLPYHYIEATYDETLTPAKFLEMVYTFFYDNTTPGLSDRERDRRAKESTAWYLRYLGYVMTPGNSAGVNLFLIGSPHNGKTTLIRASGRPLGNEYSELINIKEIYASHSGPLESYIKLAPKRLGLIDEGSGGEEKSQELGANFFKATSTADSINGRGLYQHESTVPNNVKRVFCMNEAPHFDKGLDGGTLRRMIVMPSNHYYSEADKIPDYDKIIAEQERDAIVSLMIKQCIYYINGNPDAPAGSPEREPGLLPIPDYWQDYQAQILGGPVYTSFLSQNYEPITTDDERTDIYKITRISLCRQLITYAKKYDCIDELGKIQYIYNNDGELEPALNKSAQRKLKTALIEKGFMKGDYIAGHHGTAYLYAKPIDPTKRQP